MDRYHVLILECAYQDIEDLTLYIRDELVNPQAANKIANEIFDVIENLSDFPYSNPVYVPIKPLKHEYRKVLIGNYLLFYYINELNKEIIISRVIYGKRNLSRQIKDEKDPDTVQSS